MYLFVNSLYTRLDIFIHLLGLGYNNLSVGTNGDIFVSDGYGNSSIHKFSSKGKLLKTGGGVSDQPGEFVIPHSICVDKINRVWVGDREGNCVHIFTDESKLIAYISQNPW